MNKKTLLLSLAIIGVLFVLTTTTYSLFYKKNKLANTESYATGNLSIVLDNNSSGLGNSLSLSGSYPMSDNDGMNSTPYSFRITNNGNLDYQFDLNFVGSGTLSYSYLKLMVNDNEPITLTANSAVIASNIRLRAGRSMIVNVRIWLDINTPNSEIGKSYTASLNASGLAVVNNPLDDSGANYPELVKGMIPVMYDNTNGWVKADIEHKDSSYKWYDYNEKKWANAVLVSESNRSTYMNANAGSVIPESDVLAYYVWIPRYKYKVWNINKTLNTDSYNARTTGIDIVFEKGIESTGTVSCNYDFTITEGNGLSETCSGNNGDYYTHPAFTFGSYELTGIWVGKFEMSSETPTATNGGSNSTSLTPRIKPNVVSWRANPITNIYKVIYDMQKGSNIYGLGTSRTSTDVHLLKNMEWASAAYLTNSIYGRCSNNSCSEVTFNNDSSYTTGGGDYVTNIDMTTTGNIYGIYDMNGGSWEYVMGNASSVSGSYTCNVGSGGTNFTYIGNEKYVDIYSYGATSNDISAYNRARLGDATTEVTLTAGNSGSWYGDLSNFVSSTCQWFGRGGYVNNNTGAGIFNFSCADGSGGSVHSARSSIVVLQ